MGHGAWQIRAVLSRLRSVASAGLSELWFKDPKNVGELQKHLDLPGAQQELSSGGERLAVDKTALFMK